MLLTINVELVISAESTVSVYNAFQGFVGDPKLYVLGASGTMLLVKSALKSTLSVSLSPNVIVPSQVIFPVACKSPLTFNFEVVKTTCPNPFD